MTDSSSSSSSLFCKYKPRSHYWRQAHNSIQMYSILHRTTTQQHRLNTHRSPNSPFPPIAAVPDSDQELRPLTTWSSITLALPQLHLQSAPRPKPVVTLAREQTALRTITYKILLTGPVIISFCETWRNLLSFNF